MIERAGCVGVKIIVSWQCNTTSIIYRFNYLEHQISVRYCTVDLPTHDYDVIANVNAASGNY